MTCSPDDRIRSAVTAVLGTDSPFVIGVVERLGEELLEAREEAAASAEKKWLGHLDAATVISALGSIAATSTRRKRTSSDATRLGRPPSLPVALAVATTPPPFPEGGTL